MALVAMLAKRMIPSFCMYKMPASCVAAWVTDFERVFCVVDERTNLVLTTAALPWRG